VIPGRRSIHDRVTVARAGIALPEPQGDELVLSVADFQSRVRRGMPFWRLASFREGRILVHRLETAGRPLPLALALRPMTRGTLSIEDERGRRHAIGLGELAGWALQAATEPMRVSTLLRSIEATVERLERETPSARVTKLDLAASPLYLRTDLAFGVRAGGSVGHFAGVVNTLDASTGPVIVLTTDEVPTLKPGLEIHQIAPTTAFWNFKELPMFVLNATCVEAAARAVGRRRLAFVYQRYSTNNYSGIEIARQHGVPFVLEYNGSEVWVGRHWGRPLKYEALTERVERLNANAADLIVVVSAALADELAGRGIDRDKILVNPNGVDTDRYRPDVDGSAVRARYGLQDKLVVGFIGTFGPWHGAEVLAEAFVAMLRADPELAARARLLMIGEGATLPAVRQILDRGGALDATVFTGLVPQADGPAYLAATDVLASPHVPNPDGTPFFGSPTKLFEYMAMGRGIVASDLDQIGEVLEHGRTAWLAAPGDSGALAAGLRRLLADAPLRTSLGDAARARALSSHTWQRHTARIIDALQARVAAR
jgi:glycosyltransferase involved in cell wall biosynthesis